MSWILILFFAGPMMPTAPLTAEFSSEKACWEAHTALVSEYRSHQFHNEVLGGCYRK